jgi:hypothetical protein
VIGWELSWENPGFGADWALALNARAEQKTQASISIRNEERKKHKCFIDDLAAGNTIGRQY